MLAAVDPNKCFAAAPTIPTTSYIFFQMTFAIMTPVIVSGTWAEKIHLPALFVFVILWSLIVWYPLAHWVWGGGWLAKLGAADFAGGLIVHTSSGIAAFIVALMIGIPGVREVPVLTEEKNIGLTLIGGSLIWAGWFGFNGGSFYNSGTGASLAVLNTNLSASVGSLVWGFLATLFDEHANFHLLEFLNGGLAGLAGITASAGFVDPWASSIIGAIAAVCAFGTQRFFKGKVFLNDTLDVCSLQGAPGISGSLMVGFFSNYVYKGAFFGHPIQIAYQLVAIAVTVSWTAFWTYAIMLFIRVTVGIFPDERNLQWKPTE